MEVIETILFPIIFILRASLEVFFQAVGNYGVAIVFLAILVSIITWPLDKYAKKFELKYKRIHDAMAPKLKEAKKNFKGEQHFHEIERIYKEHNYHPIKSIASVTGFALQLPFLLSSLILLISHPPLEGSGFLFLSDLSRPDGLFQMGGVELNLLPPTMALITLIETAMKTDMSKEAKLKFRIITLGILALIYSLPSAVVLYWMMINVISLFRTLLLRRLAVS